MKKIKLNNGMEMKRMLLCILVCLITTSAFCAEKLPLSMYGVVYDVGLMFICLYQIFAKNRWPTT